MAESTIVKTKRDGTLVISDNGGASSYTIAYEAGDFTLNIPGPQENHFPDRGQIAATPAVRYGDDAPMTGTLTAQLRDVSDATDVTLFEFLANSGRVNTNWVSTLGANAEVRLYTLAFTIEGTDHGDGADHTIQCNFCKISGSISEGDPDTISLSFTSYDLYPTCT